MWFSFHLVFTPSLPTCIPYRIAPNFHSRFSRTDRQPCVKMFVYAPLGVTLRHPHNPSAKFRIFFLNQKFSQYSLSPGRSGSVVLLQHWSAGIHRVSRRCCEDVGCEGGRVCEGVVGTHQRPPGPCSRKVKCSANYCAVPYIKALASKHWGYTRVLMIQSAPSLLSPVMTVLLFQHLMTPQC